MDTYRVDQLLKACPLPLKSEKANNGIIRLKIQSEKGNTNWLNITPDEFLAIERILVKG